jgi:hypothetical protein
MSSGRRAPGLLLFVLAAGTLSPLVAHAAAVTASSGRIGAGFSSVSMCGSLSSATTSWTVTSGAVTALTVGNLPGACNGAVASVSLVNTASTSIAAQSGVTVSAGSATFSGLSSNPASTSVAGVHVVLLGP